MGHQVTSVPLLCIHANEESVGSAFIRAPIRQGPTILMLIPGNVVQCNKRHCEQECLGGHGGDTAVWNSVPQPNSLCGGRAG
jgi:hypothetical protein